MSIKVSILLPNLNHRKYLETRLQSIWDQTLKDWELVVVDSYSDDGSWEFFRECAKKDKRIRIYQFKERGVYTNFNKCIHLARGEYVYFATSDDSMEPSCLEKMVKTLDEYTQCDIAHCKLRIIDEKDNLTTQVKWDNFFIVRYFGDLINQKHIRLAPHDGLLHLSGITVYTSLTQILTRKKLFDKVGLFLTNFGSIADYEWVMRATFVANTIHIPEYLATWRFHSDQVTNSDAITRAKASGQFLKMANHAMKIAKKMKPSSIKNMEIRELRYILEKEKFYYQIQRETSKWKRGWILFKWLFINYQLLTEWRDEGKQKKNFVDQKAFLINIKKMIKKYGLEKNSMRIEDNNINKTVDNQEGENC
jgi:glycosyltransferase involved in cell wall biosynthesis